MSYNYDVFISYSREDIHTAKAIFNALSSAGISCFFDENLDNPDVWNRIVEGIENCKVFLYLGSKNTAKSRFTPKELTYAINHKNKSCIYPYFIDDTPLPNTHEFLLSDINWRKKSIFPVETRLIPDLKKIILLDGEMGIGAKMHKKEEVYDVFISYYRDTGLEFAKSIHRLLTKEGYSVYFNEDSVRDGFEDENTLIHVKRCRDLILIVDTQFANKINCRENDWVKTELTEAIKRGDGIVNIIPILIQSNTILPNDILINDDAISFPEPVKVSELIGNSNTLFDRLNSRRMYVNERNAKRLQVNYDYSTNTEQSIREMTNNPLFAAFVQLIKSSEEI